MITVEEAEKIILDNIGDYGNEIVLFTKSVGRVLAETIKTDRDLPPFNRVTVDGIAISYGAFENGITTFTIKATQAAGENPVEISNQDECIEIMTGAALPFNTDTVIRYEDLEIKDGKAILTIAQIKQGQNIHQKGGDRQQGEVVAVPGQVITPALINVLASVGESEIRVKRLPRVVVISTGDEMVDVDDLPSPYQLRRSNSYTVQAILKTQGIKADVQHLPDEPVVMQQKLQHYLHTYDTLILTGAVSEGKFDYLPKVLAELQVEKFFHKVAQRPGKPFWFGKHENGVKVFAFPGNPVSVFMCTHRYLLPWLNAMLGVMEKPSVYAILDHDLTFEPKLKYFLPVKLQVNTSAQVTAAPVAGNGSGDFANLADANAFMELPLEQSEFKKGEVYRVWMFV